MNIPSLSGSDLATAATNFKQAELSQNLGIELLRKSIAVAKEQSAGLLGLLNPEHLGQHFDGRA